MGAVRNCRHLVPMKRRTNNATHHHMHSLPPYLHFRRHPKKKQAKELTWSTSGPNQ